jgi:hypothetical protein
MILNLLRRQIFLSNVIFINQFNAQSSSYKLGINQFTDLNQSEYTEILGVGASLNDYTNGWPSNGPLVRKKRQIMPVNFDLRTFGLISPVKGMIFLIFIETIFQNLLFNSRSRKLRVTFLIIYLEGKNSKKFQIYSLKLIICILSNWYNKLMATSQVIIS